MYPYTKANRLPDVLWLIQVLALADKSQRVESTLHRLRKPSSGRSWDEIADEHPEFFHVSRGKGVEVSLLVRRYNEDTPIPPISPEHTSKLIETAIKIFDSQLIHSRWWTYWVPVIGALVGAFMGALLTIFINKP